MEFKENIFDGMPIGKNDINGIDLCCGDSVIVTERVVFNDYSNPLLNFDTMTFSYRKSESFSKVNGKILYDKDYCGFVFVPSENENLHYVRKMVTDFSIKEIEKI